MSNMAALTCATMYAYSDVRIFRHAANDSHNETSKGSQGSLVEVSLFLGKLTERTRAEECVTSNDCRHDGHEIEGNGIVGIVRHDCLVLILFKMDSRVGLAG